eukprot:GHVQ01020131.1.p1 GENE.GHVQ01020131.1~~GHVQ01020131.1.p1  ORF type:complete len:166 (-),score=16.19 GHVQ01020131.1:1152-1619(-)
MAAAVMHVAPPRFLRRQPTVLAEAQRVKDKENFEVEKLVKLPTAVESKRAQKKWTIGWLLVILIQLAFCLSPFVTPVTSKFTRDSTRDHSDNALVIGSAIALAFTCVGLACMILSVSTQENPATTFGKVLLGVGGTAFGTSSIENTEIVFCDGLV